MKRRTPKRAKQEREYSKERLDFIEEQRVDGRLYCFFCGREVKEPDIHHLDGRDGDKLLDKSKWVIAHNKCHVHEYHSLSWEKIEWWCDYLKRLKKKNKYLFEKELLRMSK